jgi:DNA-binding NarL/FixJ family response regulator
MGDRPRILIVDDDPLVTSALCAFLDLQGEFEAIGCSCPLAALQRVGSEPVDLVIADYLMPSLNGLELLARLAERRPGVGRVLLTGCCGYAGAALDGLSAARLHGYLEKPWDNAVVERLLRQLLLRNDVPLAARPGLSDNRAGTRTALWSGRAWTRTPTTAT